MMDIRRNNHAAARHLIANQFSGQLFAKRDILHFFRNNALTRIVHLRKIAVAILTLAAGNPFGAGLGDAVPVVTIRRSAIRGSHKPTPPCGKLDESRLYAATWKGNPLRDHALAEGMLFL